MYQELNIDERIVNLIEEEERNLKSIYEKIDKRGKTRVNSQELFCKEAITSVPKCADVFKDRLFIPAEPIE